MCMLTVDTPSTESPRDAHSAPPVAIWLFGATLLVISLTGVLAWNQKYLLDWDACFRAFTGYAGRDILIGALAGGIRSRGDVIATLLQYADFFEARPGSLVGYPPGQTALLGLLGLVSTEQMFLCLFNVFCYLVLAWSLYTTGRQLGFKKAGHAFAWSAVCLHPTIVLTIWSLRRGLFEAAAVSLFIHWMIRFRSHPSFRTLLCLCTTITVGSLYRETLVLLLLPLAIAAGPHIRSIDYTWGRHKILTGVFSLSLVSCVCFGAGQAYLHFTERQTIFGKVEKAGDALRGGPPRAQLTIWRYFSGQFGPEQYIGLGEEALAARGAPEAVRLARGRWNLPILPHKAVYIASSIFAGLVNVLPIFLVPLLLITGHLRTSFALLCSASICLVYLVLLLPMGGIPDYITPILPGLALLGGMAISAIPRQAIRKGLAMCCLLLGAAAAAWYCIGFAKGTYEEYPPRYDYDGIATRLQSLHPEGPFGVAVDLHLSKNLAYSKFKTDPANRMAVYSLFGARWPTPALLGFAKVKRHSSILGTTRTVPGVQFLVARSLTELEEWDRILADRSVPPEHRSGTVMKLPPSPRRLWGYYRPVYIKALGPALENSL